MSCVLGAVCDWEVVHERISADIDPARQRITAMAVLAAMAHNTDPAVDPKSRKNQPNVPSAHQHLYLNCASEIDIKSVEVDGREATFWLRAFGREDDTPDPSCVPETNFLVKPPDPSNVRSLDAYDVAYNARLDWLDQGELCISIPESVVFDRKLVQAGVTDLESDVPDDMNAPVIITIHYVVDHPRSGVEFVPPSENSSRTFWSALALTEYANSSVWFPCRISHWERCTFDIDITVPSTFHVFCPGRVATNSSANDSQTKHTFFFEILEPVLARNLTFAVGEFDIVSDSVLSGSVQVTHAVVSGFATRDDLLHTVSCTNDAFSVFATYLGHSYPLTNYTQIFVDRTMTDVQSFSNLTFFSASLIHSDVIIDQTWVARRAIAEGVARSWITHLMQTRSLGDHWIIEGLVGYLVSMFVEHAFGRNERRLQRLQMTESVVDYSFLPWTYPLSSERYGHPSEIQCPHFRWKSCLVMHMLSDLIGEVPFRDIIRQLLDDTDAPNEPPTSMVVENAVGEIPSAQQLAVEKGSSGSARGISTKRLLKLCRHRSALNLDDFCDRWINGVRCPVVKVQAQFERKKSACKLRIEQVGVIMHGILKVYIYETDQQVYEHESRMDSHVESFMFSCHSKVRKNRKRFSAEIGEEGDDDDLSNGEEEMLEGDDASDVEENTDNKIGKKLKNDTPVRWVRIDPKFGWIRGLTLDQLPLWADLELRQSPDIIAQIEGAICLGRTLLKGVISAARGKEKDPLQTLMAFNGLKACLENSEYFHQVRIVAAQQLALCSRPRKLSGSDRQLSVLIEFLKSRLYNAPDRQLLEPSDFSDFSEYLVVRGVIEALSTVRVPGSGSRSPFAAMDILIDLLKYNDNSQNYYSDAYHVSTLIEALSRVYTTESEYCDRIQKEIFRFLDSEQLFPSYNHVLTCACLNAIAKIQVSRLKKQKAPMTKNLMDSSVVIAPDYDPVESASQVDKTSNGPEIKFDLLSYAVIPHPINVQIAAINAAARVAVNKPELVVSIVEIIDKQSSISVRFRMAECWAFIWSEAVIESQKALEPYSPFEAFEDVGSRPALDSIWQLLVGVHAQDSDNFRYQIWIIYASAFGFGTPKPLSSDCLSKDKEILSDRVLSKLPNAARRAAALTKQKRTHEQQFSIKQKKRPAKKADEPKTATDLPSAPPSTFPEDSAMEIL